MFVKYVTDKYCTIKLFLMMKCLIFIISVSNKQTPGTDAFGVSNTSSRP